MNLPLLRERRSYSEGPHLGQVLGSYARHPPPLHSSTLGARTATPPGPPVHSTTGVSSLLSPRAAGLSALAGSLGGIGPGCAGGGGGGPAGFTPGGYSGMQLSAVCSDIARQLASWRHSPPPEGPEDARSGGGGELSPRGAAGGIGYDSLDGSGHFGAHSGPEQHPAPHSCGGGGGGGEGAASDGFVSPPPMLGAKHHEATALFQGVASPPRLAEVSHHHHHHHHHGSLPPDAAAAAAGWWHK